MRNTINEYLSLFDFDIRKTHDARYVDQKCTPDIVCFMADCVMNMVATKPVFVINDIWETQYFVQNSRVIFNKPWANDKKAYNEYNKVLSQPLKLLAYAHILNVDKLDGALTFSVENEELLDYIARKDRNAYNFLYCYFMKENDLIFFLLLLTIICKACFIKTFRLVKTSFLPHCRTAPTRAKFSHGAPLAVALTVALVYNPAVQISVTKDNYKGHAHSPWLVVVPRRLSPTGKRQYRRFATRAAAQTYCTTIRASVRQNGEHPLGVLPATIAADALAALKLLEGTGLSLTDAVRQLLAAPTSRHVASVHSQKSGGAEEQRDHRKNSPALVTVQALATMVQENRKHLAPATKRNHATVLAALFKHCPKLATTDISTCTTHSIETALNTTWPNAAPAWNLARSVLHMLFSYATKKQLIPSNPVTPIDPRHTEETEITALPPQKLAALLAACRPPTPAEASPAFTANITQRTIATFARVSDMSDLRLYIALCAYAGIRPTECRRLRWADIDLEDNIISIRAAKSKTGGTRHIDMHPTLRAWILACRPANPQPDALITNNNSLEERLRALRHRAGIAPGEWQKDCLRHSYATFYLKARIGDITHLQLNMGHASTKLLYSRYVNMAGTTRAMAEAWWQILPNTTILQSGQ